MINVVGASGTDGDRKGSGYDVFVPTPVAKVVDEKITAALAPVTTVKPTIAPQPVGSVIPVAPTTIAPPAPNAPPAPPARDVVTTISTTSIITDTVPPSTPPSGAKPHKAIDPKKKRLTMVLGALFLILLLIGGGVAFYLSQISQDVRQQASGGTYTVNCGQCLEGQTCVPPGVGGVGTWHCSTCAAGYVGVDDVGCLAPTSAPCTGSDCNPTTPPNNPSPTTVTNPTTSPSVTIEPSPTITGEPSPTITGVLSPTADPTATIEPTLAATPTVGANVTPSIVPSGTDPTVAITPTNTQPTNTPAPTTTDNQRIVETTATCNASCTINANCANPSHVCYNGACRLDSNPEDTACRLPSGNTQTVITEEQYQRQWVASSQPASTDTLPVTGPEDWLKYLKIGLGILGIGSLLLLLL